MLHGMEKSGTLPPLQPHRAGAARQVHHAWGMTELSPTGTVNCQRADAPALPADERAAYLAKQGREMSPPHHPSKGSSRGCLEDFFMALAPSMTPFMSRTARKRSLTRAPRARPRQVRHRTGLLRRGRKGVRARRGDPGHSQVPRKLDRVGVLWDRDARGGCGRMVRHGGSRDAHA